MRAALIWVLAWALVVSRATADAGQGWEGPYRVGPFNDPDDANRVASLLLETEVSVRDRGQAATPGRGFIVTTPVLDESSARRTMAVLAESGFMDTWYVPNGPWAARVSVGVFAQRRFAEARSDEVRALGVETLVNARDGAREYWLEIRAPYLEPDLLTQIEAQLGPGTRLVELHNVPR